MIEAFVAFGLIEVKLGDGDVSRSFILPEVEDSKVAKTYGPPFPRPAASGISIF
jgi:hypothetical protein